MMRPPTSGHSQTTFSSSRKKGSAAAMVAGAGAGMAPAPSSSARARSAVTAVPDTSALARLELDGVVAPKLTPRFSVAAAFTGEDGFFLDDEKVVWEWPDLAARLIEEVR